MASRNRRRQNNNNNNHNRDRDSTDTNTNHEDNNVPQNDDRHKNIHNDDRQNGNSMKDKGTSSTVQVPEIDNNQGDDHSPLELFGEAKVKINNFYNTLYDCLVRTHKFFGDDNLGDDILRNVDRGRLERLCKSIDSIRNVLSRNQMKVAFFGRTSNGKSTVINAILRDRVLPMGYGHTTDCFLQIQGDATDEAYIEIRKDGENLVKKPIGSVGHIANALRSETLEYSTLVNIHWPTSKCPLLKYDVVLVDSPGVDVEENLDKWIDEHCHDADVFVLVSNAESTLNIAEKSFFHKVSEKLSKPNIFILNNRWDSIEDDPEFLEQVRDQHVERAVSFLTEELKISTEDEAKRRTFFVSARETLLERSQGTTKFSGYPERMRSHDRLREFEKFERCFEEALSKSAVRTKFKKHIDKGQETTEELIKIFRLTLTMVDIVSVTNIAKLRSIEYKLNSIRQLYYSEGEKRLQEYISITKRNIQIDLDNQFYSEIKRLSYIIDDFELEFSLKPEKLSLYKEQLYSYVEESLTGNLQSRVNIIIDKHASPFIKKISDMNPILSEERRQAVQNIIASQTLIQNPILDLNIYKRFYNGFHEDLEFRFSLGIFSMMRKFQSKFRPKDESKDLDYSRPEYLNSNTDPMSIFWRILMNPPQSPTTIGSLAIGGVLVRTVGWRVIIITSIIYGSLYAYEYLTWTNSAKERTFKAQYVKYAKKGLQDCVPIISQHIANSLENNMTTTFSKVKKEIDSENAELLTSIEVVKNSLGKIRECELFVYEMLEFSELLLTELSGFVTAFF